MTTAIIALTSSALKTAEAIRAHVPGAQIHGLSKRVEGADIAFDDTMAHLRGLFDDGVAIIGICASAILIRAVAPSLTNKREEPPVLAVAEDGSSVVPLLGGHRGANKLARDLATHLDVSAAVTTAGDLSLGFSLDEAPEGWTVANPTVMKPVTAALLAGEPVALVVEAGDESWPPAAPFTAPTEQTAYRVLVTDKAGCEDDHTLVVHPPVLALGVGCERNAPAGGLTAFVREQLAEAGLAEGAIAAIGSIDIKADEAAIHDLQKALGKPFRVFDAATLDQQTSRLANPSDVVFSETGCHGVAEGSALTLAGDAGELTLPKRKDAKHTMAIARAPQIDLTDKGRDRGLLYVVGIGPGVDGWRTAEAVRMLRDADEIVGYQLYLDLCADLIAGKPTHHSDLGKEEARARRAIELAAEGRKVALVCSGDPGIYALATLVFELIDRADDRAWNGVEVVTAPGISAFQAAAARIGAPINHDFCTISLSDLLTPREAILKRLNAAGEGDFVISFYNPQSLRRRTLLPEAKEILLQHRPDSCPVLIARNLGREDETITVTTLADFDPSVVDMLTLVMIGNSETRWINRAGRNIVYTPRGYAKKMED